MKIGDLFRKHFCRIRLQFILYFNIFAHWKLYFQFKNFVESFVKNIQKMQCFLLVAVQQKNVFNNNDNNNNKAYINDITWAQVYIENSKSSSIVSQIHATRWQMYF